MAKKSAAKKATTAGTKKAAGAAAAATPAHDGAAAAPAAAATPAAAAGAPATDPTRGQPLHKRLPVRLDRIIDRLKTMAKLTVRFPKDAGLATAEPGPSIAEAMLNAAGWLQQAGDRMKKLPDDFKAPRVGRAAADEPGVAVGARVSIRERFVQEYTADLKPDDLANGMEVAELRGKRLKVKLADGTTALIPRTHLLVKPLAAAPVAAAH